MRWSTRRSLTISFRSLVLQAAPGRGTGWAITPKSRFFRLERKGSGGGISTSGSAPPTSGCLSINNFLRIEVVWVPRRLVLYFFPFRAFFLRGDALFIFQACA